MPNGERAAATRACISSAAAPRSPSSSPPGLNRRPPSACVDRLLVDIPMSLVSRPRWALAWSHALLQSAVCKEGGSNPGGQHLIG